MSIITTASSIQRPTVKADPIKISKARQAIRTAQVRLLGIEKIASFTGRVAMSPEDKHVIMEVLNKLHADAEEQHSEAVKIENELLKKPDLPSAE